MARVSKFSKTDKNVPQMKILVNYHKKLKGLAKTVQFGYILENNMQPLDTHGPANPCALSENTIPKASLIPKGTFYVEKCGRRCL